ncbi:MAG TPA: NAD(P)-binding domain-containing protein, partial [Methylophilaceae bacterium]|nr:NAD(P)-binding domain-containing protein [Methylophilaceae bacterium]
MTTKNADIGLIGLAVMGQNLVLNMADHGYNVAVYNRSTDKMKDFIEYCKKNEPSYERVIGHADLATFVLSIKRPRKIVL